MGGAVPSAGNRALLQRIERVENLVTGEKQMSDRLNGCMIAVLATDGFEQVELTEPVKALKAEGAEVHVVSDKAERIQGFHHHDKGDRIEVDVVLDEADPDQYDGLVLPGGVIIPMRCG